MPARESARQSSGYALMTSEEAAEIKRDMSHKHHDHSRRVNQVSIGLGIVNLCGAAAVWLVGDFEGTCPVGLTILGFAGYNLYRGWFGYALSDPNTKYLTPNVAVGVCGLCWLYIDIRAKNGDVVGWYGYSAGAIISAITGGVLFYFFHHLEKVGKTDYTWTITLLLVYAAVASGLLGSFTGHWVVGVSALYLAVLFRFLSAAERHGMHIHDLIKNKKGGLLALLGLILSIGALLYVDWLKLRGKSMSWHAWGVFFVFISLGFGTFTIGIKLAGATICSCREPDMEEDSPDVYVRI